MRLRIMSYNIHRAIGVDRRFRPQRIVRIAEHHAPDVLLLQEVDDGVPRSRRRTLSILRSASRHRFARWVIRCSMASIPIPSA